MEHSSSSSPLLKEGDQAKKQEWPFWERRLVRAKMGRGDSEVCVWLLGTGTATEWRL